jgi:hypothetical protein
MDDPADYIDDMDNLSSIEDGVIEYFENEHDLDVTVEGIETSSPTDEHLVRVALVGINREMGEGTSLSQPQLHIPRP